MTARTLQFGSSDNLMVLAGMKMLNLTFDLSADNFQVGVDMPPVLLLDPAGNAARDILMPAEADSKNLFFIVFNTADAAEVITVKDDGDASTIATVAQNEAVLLYCDGTTWRSLVGGIT